MRRAVIAAVVVAAVLIGGGQLAQARARAAVTDALAASTSQLGDVDVELEGHPLLVRVATGRVPGAVIRATGLDLTRPPLRLERLDLDLVGVRFAPSELVTGRLSTLTVEHGTVSARIARDELVRFVGRVRPGWQLSFSAEGLAATGRVTAATVRVGVEARVSAAGLVLAARRVAAGTVDASAVADAFDATLELPTLPGGLTFREVEVDPDGVTLRGEVTGPVTLGQRAG